MKSVIFNTEFDMQYLLRNNVSLIECFNSEKHYSDINEIITLYKIKKAFDFNVSVPEWNDDKYNFLKAISKNFCKSISIFFSKLNYDILIMYVSCVDIANRIAFWELFSVLKLFKKITASEMEHVLKMTQIDIEPILLQKDIVTAYNEIIAAYFMEKPVLAELLIAQFYSEYDDKKTLYFPPALSPENRERLVVAYINSESPHINYLHLLSYSQSRSDMPISDKTKILAKRRYEKLIQEISKKGVSIAYGVQVGFKELQHDELFREEVQDKSLIYTINSKWITDNLDYPTLLNNLIYQIKLVDDNLQSNAISIKSKLGIFEAHLGLKGNKDYPIGTAFNIEQMRIELCMAAYRNILINNGVQIEEIFEWFFENYLKTEFGVENYHYSPSSSGSSYIEKIRNIIAEIDSVLKQFRMIVDDGKIDRDLFEISSEHILFNSVKSILENKYAYSISAELNKEMQCLFSNQSLLTSIKGKDKSYHSFFELMQMEKAHFSDFHSFQLTIIDWLISRGTIKIDENGIITPEYIRTKLLSRLYNKEVVCCYYWPELMPVIKKLAESGEITIKRSLFTKAETDYLNYMLNKAEFSNGLDLRNKYAHGTNTIDLNTQRSDYLMLLSIMALIVIKINEEFCLKESK